jgi:uncharacterized protein YggL (DUF469 family)
MWDVLSFLWTYDGQNIAIIVVKEGVGRWYVCTSQIGALMRTKDATLKKWLLDAAAKRRVHDGQLLTILR